MPIPPARLLLLKEAVSYVADRCEVSLAEARAALDRAFREYSLSVFSDRFEKVQDWRGAKIDWRNSRIVGGEQLAMNGIDYTVRAGVFRQHLDEWIGQSVRPAARRLTISLDEASTRVGKAEFGADWIGKLAERERWLITRYIEPQHEAGSTILTDAITFVGPGGPIVPVNDRALAAEVERARDRREQMNDQYDKVYDWFKDRGFDIEASHLDLRQFEHSFAAVFSPVAMPEGPPPRSTGGTACDSIGRIGHAPDSGATAVSNRAPDWGWWGHVPIVTLHEAIALSLDIDPKQLRRAGIDALIAGRKFDESPEFERRLALANRCLGHTLPGPENELAVRYYDEAAAVRLRDFAAWAHSVEWRLAPQLARLAHASEGQFDPAPKPDPYERRLGVQPQGKSMAEGGNRQEITVAHPAASHPSGIRTMTDVRVEAACDEWIAGLTERPRNKETAFTEAKAAVVHVGILSHKAFDRSWANRAPEGWKKAGRPKKRPTV